MNTSKILLIIALFSICLFQSVQAQTKHVSNRMRTSQINELANKAQGMILVDDETGEHLAMVQGARNMKWSGQRLQNAPNSRSINEFKSLSEVLTSTFLDLGFTLVSETSRGIEVLQGNDHGNWVNLDLDTKGEFRRPLNLLTSNRLSAENSQKLLKYLGMSEKRLEASISYLNSLGEGLPGNTLVMRHENFIACKNVLFFLLNSSDDPTEISSFDDFKTDDDSN